MWCQTVFFFSARVLNRWNSLPEPASSSSKLLTASRTSWTSWELTRWISLWTSSPLNRLAAEKKRYRTERVKMSTDSTVMQPYQVRYQVRYRETAMYRLPFANKLFTYLFYLWRKHDDTIFQQDSAPAHRARDTIELLRCNTLDFMTPDMWPPCAIWSVVQQRVYETRVHDIDELRQRLLHVCCSLEQSLISVQVYGVHVS